MLTSFRSAILFHRGLLPALLLGAATIAHAQNNVGIGTTTPDASAVLDASSTTQGMLVPRMSAAQRAAVKDPATNKPATGLLVYQTDAPAGFYFYNGTAWTSLSGSGTVGATGPAGPQGATGATGPAGPGVPTGGTAGQVLSKIDATNYNTQWTTPSTGGPSVQLYATASVARTMTTYGFSRYAFNFNNTVSGVNAGAFTSGNTYTVPAGMGGLYNIKTVMIITAYTGYTTVYPAPEIQVTSGSTVTYYYGTGIFNSLFQGNNAEATAAGSAGSPTSYGRGTSDSIIPLLAGDVVKVFFRSSTNATSTSQNYTFSADGSSFLSIIKLN
jgi:hypothetical protein